MARINVEKIYWIRYRKIKNYSGLHLMWALEVCFFFFTFQKSDVWPLEISPCTRLNFTPCLLFRPHSIDRRSQFTPRYPFTVLTVRVALRFDMRPKREHRDSLSTKTICSRFCQPCRLFFPVYVVDRTFGVH